MTVPPPPPRPDASPDGDPPRAGSAADATSGPLPDARTPPAGDLVGAETPALWGSTEGETWSARGSVAQSSDVTDRTDHVAHSTGHGSVGGDGGDGGDGTRFWGPAPDARPRTERRGWRRRLAEASPQTWVAVGVLCACTILVLAAMGGDRLLTDTTATGGDTGGHVWGPAYLRDSLLADGRLTGWSNDWYAGFAAYRFYMVLPALAVVALDVVMPYDVAFKLISVAGVAAMPWAAWGMGKMAGWRHPTPLLLGVFTLPFLFDTNFSIYGGNLASTLAGEFAFSISLAVALLAIGALLQVLRTGHGRARLAVLIALTGLCHLIPGIFLVGVVAVALVAHLVPPDPWWARLGLLGLWVAGGLAWARGVTVGWPLPSQAGAAAVVVWIGVLVVANGLRERVGRRRMWLVISSGTVGALLSAVWVLPFWASSAYVNDMGWEKIEGGTAPFQVLNNLVQPHETVDAGGKVIVVFLVLAALGAIAALARGDRAATTLALVGVASAVAFVVVPQYRLWNARLLPFWYLIVYLMAALGVAALIGALRRIIEWSDVGRQVLDSHKTPRRADDAPAAADDPGTAPAGERIGAVARVRPGPWASRVSVGVLALSALAAYVHAAQPVRLGLPLIASASDGASSWGIPGLRTTDNSYIDDWARWNYGGYQGRPAYDEYHGVITRMGEVGREVGCGRALWEYDKEVLDTYGTPMALMLLPMFTDGCIDSMEGLFFEASITVPFHFIAQDNLSVDPSRPMRDLPYPEAVDVATGVEQLRLLGGRYYMAVNDETVTQALDHPDLELVAVSGPWRVFELVDHALVAPLAYEPVVAVELGEAGREWIDPAVSWWNDSAARAVPLALDGPAGWARIGRDGEVPRQRLRPVTVGEVVEDDHELSFSVDTVGVPVAVRSSYFPNWTAEGADGPYRVTPNTMVVIPTRNDVTLTFERSGTDWLAMVLSVVGLILAVVLARRPLDPERRPAPDDDLGEWPFEGVAPVRAGLASGADDEPEAPDPVGPVGPDR